MTIVIKFDLSSDKKTYYVTENIDKDDLTYYEKSIIRDFIVEFKRHQKVL
jgi:hypothetical protein